MKKYQSPDITRKQIELIIIQILTTFVISENYKMFYDDENNISGFKIDEFEFKITPEFDGKIYIEPVFKSLDRIVDYYISFKRNREYTPEHLFKSISDGVKTIIQDFKEYPSRKIEAEKQKEENIKQMLEFEDIKKFLEKKLDCTVNNNAKFYETYGYTVDKYIGTCYPFIIQDTGEGYKISAVGYGSVDGDTFDYWTNNPIENIINNDFILEYESYSGEVDNMNSEIYHIDKKFYNDLKNALIEYTEKFYIDLNT